MLQTNREEKKRHPRPNMFYTNSLAGALICILYESYIYIYIILGSCSKCTMMQGGFQNDCRFNCRMYFKPQFQFNCKCDINCATHALNNCISTPCVTHRALAILGTLLEPSTLHWSHGTPKEYLLNVGERTYSIVWGTCWASVSGWVSPTSLQLYS